MSFARAGRAVAVTPGAGALVSLAGHERAVLFALAAHVTVADSAGPRASVHS